MTNTQKIETSREVRLWIGQIIVPGVTLTASLLAIPEVRQAVAMKARYMKQSIQEKMNERRKP